MSKKKILVIGATIIVSLIGIVLVILMQKKTKTLPQVEKKSDETILPTLDSSVQVSLDQAVAGKEVVLKILGIPKNTTTVEYELSYQTAKQGLQGVIGTISLEDETSYQKKLTLGTCSSGTCVYHQVVGTIKLTLKFSGDYGDKLFEKEFGL